MALNMKMLLGLSMAALVCHALNAQTPVPAPCPSMEVSVVADAADGSTRNLTSTQGRMVSLVEKPLLTTDDFADANISITEGQLVLNVTMTPEGARRIQAFSAANVGRVLAFVANGRVVKTPRILDPITGTGFLIGAFDRDEAQRLADSINHRDAACTQASATTLP